MSTSVAIVGDVHLMENSPRSWRADYFSVVMAELEWAIANHDQTIILGDVFHRPCLPDKNKTVLLQMLKRLGKPVMTILGNHDFFNMNVSTLERTTLGLMSETGWLKLIESVVIEGVSFETIPMDRNPVVPKSSTGYSVLLGHVYYDSPLDPRFSIRKEDLVGKGFKLILLGHDHEPHPPVKFEDGAVMMRFGSLCRHTSHQYNLDRKPRVLRLSCESGRITAMTLVEVPTLASSEVFHPEAFQKPDKGNMAFIQNLDHLFESFEKASAKMGRVSMKEALVAAGTPDFLVEYVRSLYQRRSLNFN